MNSQRSNKLFWAGGAQIQPFSHLWFLSGLPGTD